MRFPQFGKLGILAALRAAERRAAEHDAMIAALRAENDALRSELGGLRDTLRHEVMRLSPVIASMARRGHTADTEEEHRTPSEVVMTENDRARARRS